MTAVDPDVDIIEMPFDAYVIKPVSRDDLFEAIDRLLTCSEYEEKLREYYALLAKHATLQDNKPESELASSDEFSDLEDRMNAIQAELDETVTGFDDEDFIAAFRDIEDPSAETIED